MKVHAHFFVCLFLVLENLEQRSVSGFGTLGSEQDFQTPEFVSTNYAILNLYSLARGFSQSGERGFVCVCVLMKSCLQWLQIWHKSHLQ